MFRVDLNHPRTHKHHPSTRNIFRFKTDTPASGSSTATHTHTHTRGPPKSKAQRFHIVYIHRLYTNNANITITQGHPYSRLLALWHRCEAHPEHTLPSYISLGTCQACHQNQRKPPNTHTHTNTQVTYARHTRTNQPNEATLSISRVHREVAAF